MIIDDVFIANRLISLKHSAERRKLRFEVTFGKLKRELNRKRCYYTGVLIDDTKPPHHISIDRKDNDKGYTDDNIVGCTVMANQFKANLTIDQIGKLYDKIK
jgi:hypothetical protein